MRILHVALGLPPLRTGGSIGYCEDLIQRQADSGLMVGLLFPGRVEKGKTRINHSSKGGIELFEVVDPLPVALTYGVDDPKQATQGCSSDVYRQLLSQFKPDLIHVHSIMGIHKEFFEVVTEEGIPSVFSTHDYYPICLRCTFVDADGEICPGPSPERCARCNFGKGIPSFQNQIMQSGWYSKLKASPIFSPLKRFGKMVVENRSNGQAKNGSISKDVIDGYDNLLALYSHVLNSFDALICNSVITKSIYSEHVDQKKISLLPLTKSGLKMFDKAERDDGVYRIGYFGGRKAYKGYDLLMEALQDFDSFDFEWELRLYGDEYPKQSNSKVIACGPYRSEEAQDLMRSLDLVIVPSQCPETFGFVALEALCSGVAVVASDSVGASYLIPPEFVFSNGNRKAMVEAVLAARSSYNCSALFAEYDFSLDFSDHEGKVREIYKSVIQNKGC